MADTLFMGASIPLASFARDEAPGAWWPRASFRSTHGAAPKSVAASEHYSSKNDADAAALRLAMRLIREELHQG